MHLEKTKDLEPTCHCQMSVCRSECVSDTEVYAGLAGGWYNPNQQFLSCHPIMSILLLDPDLLSCCSLSGQWWYPANCISQYSK